MTNATTASTFIPLNGRLDWRTGRRDGISVSNAGLRLEAAPGGPLSLTWIDGSLGGLTLPRGFAIDSTGTLYLLDPAPRRRPAGGRPSAQRIRRYDRATQTFVPLGGFGEWGDGPRQVRDASNISLSGRRLYVADAGNRRVQVLSLEATHLVHVWTVHRSAVDAPTQVADPLDVASGPAYTYILDGARARVWRHQCGTDTLSVFLDVDPAARQWTRAAVDRVGRLYLLDAGRRLIDVYAPDGKWLSQVQDAGDVRDRFDPPPLTLIFDGRSPEPDPASGFFRLPPSLAGTSEDDLSFDRRGRRIRIVASDLAEPPRYLKSGIWVSQPLDSGIHACQWHQLQVHLPTLPAGSRVVISTFAADSPASHPHESSALWQASLQAWGPTARSGGSPQANVTDSLVQSREGQYLWLLVRLESDGFDTPLVQGIEAHYPRTSYLKYLPAIYSADDESRWFLERFLSIVQTEWDQIEGQVRDVARYFDVNAAPAEGWLEMLARWVAVPLEQSWQPEQKRNLLRVASRLLGRRGTPAALRAFVQAYLQNMTGIPPEQQGRWPEILEGVRERHRVLLSTFPHGELGRAAVLWSPSVVGRPELDTFSREGSMRLVSTGDPARDLFHQYSHRFTVMVPAAWLRTAEDEQMLRRAIDAEKPAHTEYHLRLVEPWFRVGVQSTVGVDTIVGDYTVARLGGACSTAVPSRRPRNRLGYDTVLAASAAVAEGVQINRSRIGLDTVLT